MAFIGPLSALISTIPGNVIGGVTFLLYGMIASSELGFLVDKKVDYSKSENLVLSSVVFISGLSGLNKAWDMELKGMVLASVVAVVLSLLLYLLKKAGLTNE